jgi:hypothetical protein
MKCLCFGHVWHFVRKREESVIAESEAKSLLSENEPNFAFLAQQMLCFGLKESHPLLSA